MGHLLDTLRGITRVRETRFELALPRGTWLPKPEPEALRWSYSMPDGLQQVTVSLFEPPNRLDREARRTWLAQLLTVRTEAESSVSPHPVTLTPPEHYEEDAFCSVTFHGVEAFSMRILSCSIYVLPYVAAVVYFEALGIKPYRFSRRAAVVFESFDVEEETGA